MTQRGEDLLNSRRAKLLALRSQGIDPYPSKSSRRHTCLEAAQIFIKHEDENTPRSTSVAGRILRLRNMGKASFIDIEDRTGRLQLFIRANESSKSFDLVDNLDLGDFVSPGGLGTDPVFRSTVCRKLDFWPHRTLTWALPNESTTRSRNDITQSH